MGTSGQDQVTFWRTVAAGLAEGRPVVACLEQARRELRDTALCEPIGQIIADIRDGHVFSEAMRARGGLFDDRIVEAVRNGEQTGVLDVTAGRIAEALEADDLGLLDKVASGEASVPGSASVAAHLNEVIHQAAAARASDIHFEPREDSGGRIRFRVDGVLREQERLTGEPYARMVQQVKAMAGMDLAERRLPQDGRFLVEIEGRRHDLRVSSVPAIWGERIVCRILAEHTATFGMEEIGLGGEDAGKVRRLATLPSGMVIVNGPTGCGKTTVLYSMLKEVNKEACCVMTVEDPVEYTFDGISQIPIRPAVGLTFARAIRSVLRQDPDVIMVGELRDLEMMSLSVQVAMTGHLLLTSLHAQTSAGAIQRLIDVGLEPFLVNAALAGVITPRLVRVLCKHCRRPAEPQEHMMPPRAWEIVSRLSDGEFCEPVGCERCGGMGFRGRTAIYEILVMDDRIRRCVTKPVNVAAIREAAREGGMKTLLEDGLQKAARGVTAVREILRIVPHGTHA